MSESEKEPWWRNPQQVVAISAIVTMILGFFYVREKQLWEDKRAIESLEARGGAAILEMRTELEKLRLRLAGAERSIWELEHRVSNDPEARSGNQGGRP